MDTQKPNEDQRIGTSCDQHNCFDNHCTAGLLCPCECHNRLLEDGSVSYRRYPPEEGR